MAEKGLADLLELFGSYSGIFIDTGFSIGGSSGREILDKDFNPTGYFIGSFGGRYILCRDNEKFLCIGRLVGSLGREIADMKGNETTFFIGGSTGRKIMYSKKD